MANRSRPTPPNWRMTQWWILGTTAISILGVLIWVGALLSGPMAGKGRIGWAVLLPYILILTLRVWVTLAPPRQHVRFWHRNVGVLYWLVTLPFLWIAGFLVLYWNGVPS
jgi:hypothetical protein